MRIFMLTDSQRKTLQFIRAYIEKHDYAPTFPEIARGIGISSQGSAHRYVKNLIEQGYLENSDGRHRGLRLVKESPEGHIPLLGKIAAGLPIEAIPGNDEINLLDYCAGPGRFAVKVCGDSMIDMGIMDGDIAIIKACDTARRNDIVVALIDEQEATLKRFQPMDKHQVKLIPANQSMEAMVYAASRVRIQGVLLASLRQY
ncbi:MAG: transcriptional repressor LexA [Gammaproteobacteria bacterium]|nr:transcriptional repressor LexA [Gammaproteobacteria bacterium]